MSSQEYESGKFYTGARRFQQLIGVLPDGTAIWGGPYTLTQAITALSVAVVLGTTRYFGWWSIQILADIALILGAAIGIGWVTGKLPKSRRSVFLMSQSVLELTGRPKMGNYRGKSLDRSFGKRAKNTRETRDVEEIPAPVVNHEAPSSGLEKLKRKKLEKPTPKS